MFLSLCRKMSAPKVEQISAPMVLGEGPHWDHDAQVLYFVDIKSSTIHKYVPATNKHTTVKISKYWLFMNKKQQ
jgi:sugar lactone lactonase YvrE